MDHNNLIIEHEVIVEERDTKIFVDPVGDK